MNEKKSSQNENFEIALVIFGVTGDLTRRKLLPALYQLQSDHRLPASLQIIGFARRPWDDRQLAEELSAGICEFARKKPAQEEIINDLLAGSKYFQSDFNDRQGFTKLLKYLDEKKHRLVIFYLATPPDDYEVIIQNLSVCRNFTSDADKVRIVVEKPYGRDLDSAQTLENILHQCFSEEQIYRIDHYLGKETVQNILVFRFANGIFEPLWNNHYIDHVQITVAETVGVGNRAGYFDKSGVIRDMFANHLLQLVTLTAMEVPYAFNESSVRDEKMKVLRSFRPMKKEAALVNTVRGQYSGGKIGEEVIKGYLQEERVTADSTTETYLAAKIFIDNWRWAGVPFYIRSGKMLPARETEIAIQFKQVPLPLFNWENMAGVAPNVLVMRLQPDEGIDLSLGAKMPGPINQIAPVKMQFYYQEAFGAEPPEAYERLLLDCIQGDQTLFTRTDEVIEQWRFVTDILKAWEENPVKRLPQYMPGSWGPKDADDFIRQDQRQWRTPGVKN